jgi:RNA polymerase sigma-70 factor, ECF subfamily
MATPDRGEQFVRLFVQHQKRIQGLILALVPKGSDADDILQETSAVLWQKFSEFELGTNFAAWALRIARFQVMAYYTSKKRERARLSDESLDAVVEKMAARPLRAEPRSELLDGCLAGLERSDRDLLEQRYRGGATVEELARQSGKTVFSVYKALNRAHDRLLMCMRGRLGPEGAV